MKTGILGGSFNPPHNGHLYLGEQMRNELSLDRILVIPTAKSPHKSDIDSAPDTDRLEMCALLFADSFYTVSDLELRRGGKSYTVDTMRELKRMHHEDDFYLLVGSDMLLYFDKWYKWQEILSLCTLCSFARDDNHSAEEMKAYARETLNSEKVRIFDAPPREISSTRIRDMLANGMDTDGLLPRDLADYIKKKGLYIQS